MTGTTRNAVYDTSTDPSRGRFRREVASVLGLFVILFNLVAGTLLATTSQTGAAPFLEEVFGSRIVVCTGAGMIVVDADGNTVPPDGSTAALCVYCLPLTAGSADAPVLVSLLEAPRVVLLGGWIEPSPIVAAGAPIDLSKAPRGPPLV